MSERRTDEENDDVISDVFDELHAANADLRAQLDAAEQKLKAETRLIQTIQEALATGWSDSPTREGAIMDRIYVLREERAAAEREKVRLKADLDTAARALNDARTEVFLAINEALVPLGVSVARGLKADGTYWYEGLRIPTLTTDEDAEGQ